MPIFNSRTRFRLISDTWSSYTPNQQADAGWFCSSNRKHAFRATFTALFGREGLRLVGEKGIIHSVYILYVVGRCRSPWRRHVDRLFGT